jgi:hypothetical protein
MSRYGSWWGMVRSRLFRRQDAGGSYRLLEDLESLFQFLFTTIELFESIVKLLCFGRARQPSPFPVHVRFYKPFEIMSTREDYI